MSNKSFETREQYFAFREAFRNLAKQGKITPGYMVIYQTLRGKDSRYGFSPVSNTKKLNCNCNGNPWFNHNILMSSIRYNLQSIMEVQGPTGWIKQLSIDFAGTITDDAFQYLLQELCPNIVINQRIAA